MTATQPDPRRLAYHAKARGLVRGHWGDEVAGGDVHDLPGGAALTSPSGDAVFVLAERSPSRSLGPALAIAERRGAGALHLMASAAAGELCRRAGTFGPAPVVWAIRGTKLVAVEPAPFPPAPFVDPRALDFASMIAAAGADPVVEGGTLLAEVNGLEVARVVSDPGGVRLEVGVGKHDREAQQRLRGDQPPEDVLRLAVDAVARQRRPDARPHQINQIARERWLRCILTRRPELIDAAMLEPAEATVGRDDLRRAAPAPAVGTTLDGEPVVVVCSVGVDLDLVPAAADARLEYRSDARLVIVVPEGDDHPITRRLAARLVAPAEIRTVGREWERL